MSAIFLGMLQIPEVRGWTATSEGQRLIRHPWSRLFATMCLHRTWACLNLVDFYRQIAGDKPGSRRRLHFRVRDEARVQAGELLEEHGVGEDESLIAIQPGASRAIRQWPAERYAAVAHALSAGGVRCVVVGGGSDHDLGESIRSAAGGSADVLNLAGKTPIPVLAALLDRCRLLVTGDTGPMHLAAALDTPIVGLFFGPAMPEDTGPYGEDHLLVHAAVPCAPCDHQSRCGAPFCREEISSELVTQLAQAQLAGEPPATLRGLGAGVRVLRSEFDRHGFFAVRPLPGSVPHPQDELRAAYRATFLHVLEGVGAVHGLSQLAARQPFGALAALAREAGGLARRLDQVSQSGADTGAMESLHQQLGAVEAAMKELGGVHAELAPLVRLAEFEREDLPAGDVSTVARAWAEIHDALAHQADCFARGSAATGGQIDPGGTYASISE